MTETAAGWLAASWRFFTVTHDPIFVIGAVVVCLAAFGVGFRSLLVWRDDPSERRTFWLLLGLSAFGAGVWSTHFFAMLGWRPDLALGFDAQSTMLSAVIALAGVGPALFWGASRRSALGDALGGAGAALASTAMHVLAVETLGGCGPAQDQGAIAALALLCAVFAAAALRALRRGRRRRTITASGLFLLGLAALHFGGLAATTVGAGGALGPMDLPRGAVQPVMVFLANALSLAFAAVAWAHGRGEAEISRLSAIATHSHNAVLLLDPGGRVTWVNPALSGHTGLTLRDLEGKRPCEALRADGADPEACAGLAAAIDAQRNWETEVEFRTRRGEPYWAQASVLPVRDYAGAVRAQVLVLNDVTDIKAREAELEAARDRAEAASRAKSEFISVMSHELRTPLNGVLGMAGLLAASPLDDRQRAQLGQVRASGEALLRVLSDILEFAADGGDAAPRATFSPAALLDDLGQIVEGDAAAKGLTFSTRLGADLPALAQGDAETLGRALLRLADNAVKFTERGGVEMAMRRDPRDPTALVCEVRDTGPGFPEGATARLFDGFAQGDSSATRRGGGLGLGLALCRRGAQRMGGRVEAETLAGGGACVRIALPGALAMAADAPAPAVPDFALTG